MTDDQDKLIADLLEHARTPCGNWIFRRDLRRYYQFLKQRELDETKKKGVQ